MRTLVTSCMLFQVVALLGQGITDELVHPAPPPPALPAAGGTFTDAVFGTTLMRVTDATDGDDNTHSYSYWRTLNNNDDRLMIYSVGGWPALYDLDTTTFAISNKRDVFATVAPDGGWPRVDDACWSWDEPYLLYAHTDKNLYSYNVDNGVYTLLKEFAPLYPDIFLWQMSMSFGDSVFSFTRRDDVNYENLGAMVWHRNSDQLQELTGLDFDELKVDKTGAYAHVALNTSGFGVVEGLVWNLATNAIDSLTDSPPDHNPGHGDVGVGAIIGADNWDNRLLLRSFDDPHNFTVVRSFGNDWSQDVHGSWRADDESMILLSMYLGSALPNSGLFTNEIFFVRTDGSQQVWRLAHHHTNVIPLLDAGDYGAAYYASPRASISRSGRFVTFTSNWGDTSRTDVFLLRVPTDFTTAVGTEISPSVRVLPALAQEQVTVIHPWSGAVRYNLCASDGRQTIHGAVRSGEVIPVGALNSGTYVLSLYPEGSPGWTGRLVVQ